MGWLRAVLLTSKHKMRLLLRLRGTTSRRRMRRRRELIGLRRVVWNLRVHSGMMLRRAVPIPVNRRVAGRARAGDGCARVRIRRHVSVSIFKAAIFFHGLLLTTTHADITPDPNTTSLAGHFLRQMSTLAEAWELLRAVDGERLGLDVQTEMHKLLGRAGLHGVTGGVRPGWGPVLVLVLVVFYLFVQVEVQPVVALVADRQVGENEVAGRRRTAQIRNACHGGTRQYGDGWLSLDTAVGHRTGELESREEEEIGIVAEGDVLVQAVGIRLVDADLDDGWWVDWSTVRRSCINRSSQ